MTNEDDLLNLLESDDKPFANEETAASKPDTGKQEYKGNNTYQGGNKNKINLWEDTEIEPTKLDRSKMNPLGKYFTIVFHKGDDAIPPEIEKKFVDISKILMAKGFMLRYNGDQEPFINQVLDIDLARVEMYLPWKSFNTSITPKMKRPNEKAYHVAAYYHKAFKKLPNPVRAILARDVHVILGENVDNPIKLMLCYSPDGAETIKQIDYKKTGNISFSISICDVLGIPVFNLKNEDAVSRLVELVKTF